MHNFYKVYLISIKLLPNNNNVCLIINNYSMSFLLTAAVNGGEGCGMDSGSDELACCELSNDMAQEQ